MEVRKKGSIGLKGGIGMEELKGGFGKLKTRKERKTAGNVDKLKNARY
jgi:hypothetical protein